MAVTYSRAKDAANFRKHGISLKCAEDIDFDTAWFDLDDSQDYVEVRYNAIGRLDGRLHTLTFTYMTDGTVRAISLRKSARGEQKLDADAY